MANTSIRSIRRAFLAASLSLAALGGSSQAFAVQIFTDRAAFEAALVGATLTEDPFDNFIPSALSITFDSGVVSTLSDPGGLSSNDNRVQFGQYISDVVADSESISFDFPFPIFAFGADFLGANFNRLQISADFDGDGIQTFLVANTIGGSGPVVSGFLGFIGDAAFSELVLSNASITFDGFAIDNLAFAATPTGVPEPASLALLGLGIAGLGLLRRRRA